MQFSWQLLDIISELKNNVC